MPQPPGKRLRRLADIEEGDSNQVAGEAEEPEISEEYEDWDWDGEEERKEEVVRVARSTRRTVGGSVLEGRSTNGDVVASTSKRRSTKGRGVGTGTTKTRSKRTIAEEKEMEGGSNGVSTKRKKRTAVKVEGGDKAKRVKPSLPPTTQAEKDKKSIKSFFGTKGVTVSASVFSSSQQPQQLSQPISGITKLTISKPVTSKPIASSQPVILEDLDDLIQDWDSDGFDEDEAEILGTAGTQVGSGVVVVKKEMVVGGWGSQLSQPQTQFISNSQQPKKPLPIFRKPASHPSQMDQKLPWPMKHAPRDSIGLAIHKKKVLEVSTWLSSVYEGRSRKRALVLKGPTGCGKTATLEVLAKEGGWDIVEWGNPTGGAGGADNSGSDGFEGWKPGAGDSFAAAFEDWLFRGGTLGCLDLVSSSGATATSSQQYTANSGRRKLLLLEDLPNLAHAGTLLSFRAAIRGYLSLPSPPAGSGMPPISPLVIIVSEASEGAGSSTSMSMSVHKMLGTQILSHPLLSEIQFRKVAKTLLVKCMEDVVKKEGYAELFGKDILETLAEQGDLRSAIGGLEILALGRDKQVVLGELSKRVSGARKRKKSPASTMSKEILGLLNPRMSTLGIFHSIGKVVYNKRYGDDPTDPYYPAPQSPPAELKGIHRYHARAMKIDPNTILDESGVDAGMFIYGVQENYIGSCNQLGGGAKKTLEELLEDVCFCAEGLSEGDILMGAHSFSGGMSGDLGSGISRAGIWSGSGAGGSNGGGGDGILRQEDIVTQVVVRSMALGLPSPIKRGKTTGNAYSDGRFASEGENGNGFGNGRGGSQLYYPMGVRLWRMKEEIEAIVELWEGRVRDGKSLGASGRVAAGPFVMAGLTKAELVLERLPFMAKIAKGKTGEAFRWSSISSGAKKWENPTPLNGNSNQQPGGNSKTISFQASPAIIRSLEQATVFRGIGFQTVVEPDDEGTDATGAMGQSRSLLNLDEDTPDSVLMPPPPRPVGAGKQTKGRNPQVDTVGILNEGVSGMVLEEDDIEDDDNW